MMGIKEIVLGVMMGASLFSMSAFAAEPQPSPTAAPVPRSGGIELKGIASTRNYEARFQYAKLSFKEKLVKGAIATSYSGSLNIQFYDTLEADICTIQVDAAKDSVLDLDSSESVRFRTKYGFLSSEGRMYCIFRGDGGTYKIKLLIRARQNANGTRDLYLKLTDLKRNTVLFNMDSKDARGLTINILK